MKSMELKVWVAVIWLVSASVACSLSSSRAVTTSEPTGIPDLAKDLAGVNSYRARMVFRRIPDEGAPELRETSVEETRNPLAQRTIVTTSEETIEQTYVMGTTWFCTNGTCQPQLGGEEPIYGILASLGPYDITEIVDKGGYRFEGEEMVNGVHTFHYIMIPSQGENSTLGGKPVSDMQGEVWVAHEEELPAMMVRAVYSWTKTTNGSQDRIEYSFDIYDINEPFTIEPPEGRPASMSEEIPFYPAGTKTLSLGGISYPVEEDDPAVVADFYHTELSDLGWMQKSGRELDGTFIQSWSKAGWCLSVTIAPEDSGCRVTIDMIVCERE